MIRGFGKSFKKAGKLADILWQEVTVKRPHMAYVGWWSDTPNLGDKALYAAAKQLFHRCGFIDYPFGARRVVGPPVKLFGIIKYGLLAGGTVINRSPHGLKMAKECFPVCKYTFVFGSGVANPSFWSGRSNWKDTLAQWKPLLERCEYIGVRGPMSAEMLTNMGLNNVEVIGDPILVFAEDSPQDDASCIPRSIGLNIGHSRIAPSKEDMWGSQQRFCTEFVKLASLAAKAGWKVRWFVADPRDLELTKKIAKASGTANEIYDTFEDHTEYLDLVRPMSVFVGMKLHAVALATCAYVPSVMLEYRPKCRDYMQAIGQDAAAIRTDKFDAEDVFEIVQDWNSRRQQISENLYYNIKPVSNRQRQKANDLIENLEKTR